jgi:ribosome biogenesis protein ENP2
MLTLRNRLGLTHLVGTSALKPYMHGYFLSLKLYSTARLMANPNSYDEHREKLINARMEAKAESRIRARKEQPKVNKALAERLRRAEESGAGKKGRKDADAIAAEADGGVLADPRFKELFENPEYEVDEQSREFALLNPATVHNANSVGAVRKTAVQDEEDDSAGSSSGVGESDDEDDEDDEDGEQVEDDEGVSDDDKEDGDSDDSDEGDLRQYDPRKLRPGEE